VSLTAEKGKPGAARSQRLGHHMWLNPDSATWEREGEGIRPLVLTQKPLSHSAGSGASNHARQISSGALLSAGWDPLQVRTRAVNRSWRNLANIQLGTGRPCTPKGKSRSLKGPPCAVRYGNYSRPESPPWTVGWKDLQGLRMVPALLGECPHPDTLGDRALGEAGAGRRPPPFQLHGNGMCTQHHVSGILPKQLHVITLLISDEVSK
jgi:hypothetical protein